MLATPALLGIKHDWFFWLMDTKFFNFIAKISFWTYLIHYMIIEFICYRQKTDFYYDVGDVLSLYIPAAVIAMFFGFIGTLLIENPFAKL
jgi:peptidoglycan/LPS O-acetylase OafA/YrhL